jgi:hypothetical protein
MSDIPLGQKSMLPDLSMSEPIEEPEPIIKNMPAWRAIVGDDKYQTHFNKLLGSASEPLEESFDDLADLCSGVFRSQCKYLFI